MALSSNQAVDDIHRSIAATPERRRKRAITACVQCRAHKVRCDVLGHPPCIRCRIEGIACITEGRRRRAPVIREPPQLRQPVQETLAPARLTANYLASDLSIQPVTPTDTYDFPPSGAVTFELEEIDSLDVPAFNEQGFSCTTDPFNLEFEPEEIDYSLDIPAFDEQGFGCTTNPLNLDILDNHDPSLDGSNSRSNYAAKTEVSHLAPEDIAYLTAKDVFKLPQKSVQDELVDKYFLYVHPFLPIINESAFRNDYVGGLANTSLLVYRAMLYGATSYISEKSLELSGFHSILEAEKTHFARARLIFDFDVERAKLARVQASLIFSFWAPSPKVQPSRRNSYWLSGAITIAKELGLNREDVVSKFEPSAQKVMKRIWWACVMRDIVLAFTYRHPPLLGPDDYSIGILQVEELFDSSECWIAYPGVASQIIARSYVQLTRLAAVSGKFLEEKFAPRNCPSSKIQSASSSPTPLVNLLLDIERANIELAIWKRSFLAEDFSCLDAGEEVYKDIILHRNFVFALYNAIIIILNQPSHRWSECLLSSWSEGIQDLLESSWERTRTAAFDIISLVKELIHLGMTKFLPISLSSILASATLVRSLNNHLERPTETSYKDTSIQVCFHALEAMKFRFVVMQDVINIVKDIICFLGKQPSPSLIETPSMDSSQVLWSRFRDNGNAVRVVMEILRATCYINISIANEGVVQEADLPMLLSW